MAELVSYTQSSRSTIPNDVQKADSDSVEVINNLGDFRDAACEKQNGHPQQRNTTGDSKFMGLEYRVDDLPAPHMCFIFGLQQVLLAISSTISIPLIVSGIICAGDLQLVKSEIMSTFLIMCGTCTILQVVVGVRLPIVQGGSHKFIPAIAALMALDKWQCPDISALDAVDSTNSTLNDTTPILDRTEVWQSRMREIQGGIMLASLTQVLIGCTGLLGFLLQYIGPITIVPTITLVGLSLVDVAILFCEKHWGIAALTVGLVFIFSLYLRNISIPAPAWSKVKRCHVAKFPIFQLLPVLLAVIIAWGLCGILTATNVFTSDKSVPEYSARVDSKVEVIHNARWFFFPYPGQWGLPTVSVASFMAMLAATIASIIESVGDYYACARISGCVPPPAHAVNRGIAIEGFGSIIAGLLGSGGATTSYSQNVGAIGFTKVASRGAFFTAGLIFLLGGLFGKIGAVLVMLPDPVLGGIVVISFGMVTSVGLSNLQFVDLSSGRNLSIIGSSLLIGLMVPKYLQDNPNVINTGSAEFDQVVVVLLSTAMFVGGILGFILDNTVPGSEEERGIISWRKQLSSPDNDKKDHSQNVSAQISPIHIYDLPLITPLLRKLSCSRYVPFLPTFDYKLPTLSRGCCKRHKKSSK